MPASPDILHPIAISQVMIHFAASHGLDRDSCLLGTGIDPPQLQEAEALISREQELRLLENIVLALPHVGAIGFRLGLQYNVSTFGIWGFALRTSRSLFEALQHALRYLPLSTAYCRMQVLEEDGLLGISMNPDEIPRHLRQVLLERDMATAINLIRELSLTGLQVRQIEMQIREPDHAAEIAELCGITPRFGSARNALWLPGDAARTPLSTFDPHLVRLLEDQCRQQLERRQQGGLRGLVRGQLLGPLGLIASLEDVAEALAMSPRSLRRKLEAEGSSFRQILEEERRLLARRLLDATQMTLDEMAIHLGYADTASFSRAFRRWHTLSPGEYRRRQRSADQAGAD